MKENQFVFWEDMVTYSGKFDFNDLDTDRESITVADVTLEDTPPVSAACRDRRGNKYYIGIQKNMTYLKLPEEKTVCYLVNEGGFPE